MPGSIRESSCTIEYSAQVKYETRLEKYVRRYFPRIVQGDRIDSLGTSVDVILQRILYKLKRERMAIEKTIAGRSMPKCRKLAQYLHDRKFINFINIFPIETR